jgi:hypothetical protein
MTVPPVLSLTESQELSVLRAFLLTAVPLGVDVVRGQGNRVAEPTDADFVVFWPLRQSRLATNIAEYYDNVITGSIVGTTLTVGTIAKSESPLSAGMLLTDGTAGQIASKTILGIQVSGSVGGTGIYNVLPSQTLPAETLYAGQTAYLTPVEWTVQCDVHGPNSGDNARIIDTLFRSETGVNTFIASATALGLPTDYGVIPLYCDEARYLPFLNDQQQVEYRWVLELRMQINPIVSVPLDFATSIDVMALPADIVYTP